jgi:hypothetical protein
MNRLILPAGILLWTLFIPSCFKEIDTESIPRTVDETFTVQHSIKKIQSFHRFYENAVLEVDTAVGTDWDLAFESAGSGNRVLLGWASLSTAVGTGVYDFSEINQDLLLDLIDNSEDWVFDDPSFVTIPDSLALTGHWEDGEIWLQNRGLERDNYYVIQYVGSTDESYSFKYASAQSLDQVHETTVYRSTGFNYVYYSYAAQATVPVEPLRGVWDLLFTPYSGWWETSDSGVYVPYNLSGALINNETGVRIAHVFDPEIAFEDIDLSYVDLYEFTDLKGAIGANWKILGAVGSPNLYTMDPDKKYLLKKYDQETSRTMYFKFQFVDYKLNGEDHYPTVEFKFLGSEPG